MPVPNEGIPIRSPWRCARCDERKWDVVTWLWRNSRFGSALVTCSNCGFKWQEPGWEFDSDEGVWVNRWFEKDGLPDGRSVFTTRRRASIEAERTASGS
jgi:hypothetical protein